MGLKGLMRAGVLCVALSSPAVAQGLEPCAQPFASAENFFGALSATGWSAPKIDVTDALMWINAVAYLGGDTGGATLREVLRSQRMAAANYGRLKALPISQTEILSNGSAVMLASWQRPTAAVTSVQCRVAMDDPNGPATVTGFGAHTDARVAADNPGLSEYHFHYNLTAIRAELPDATPPQMVRNIRHEFFAEGVQ
jgi:hypothetical protein